MISNFELMNRFLIVIILIKVILISDLLAQQSLKGRFGIGIGYSTGIEFSKFETLNEKFLRSNEKGLSDNLQINGFTGYFYFLILPDTRISLNFLQGEKEIQSSTGRFLRYEQNYWSAGLEYTFSIYRFNVSPGLMIGGVTDYIELIDYDASSKFSDILSNFNQSNFSSVSINFENTSFHISPGICFEYSLSRFVAMRIGYVYKIRLTKDWKLMRRFPISDFPDEILNNNHFLNFGILIGFMSK